MPSDLTGDGTTGAGSSRLGTTGAGSSSPDSARARSTEARTAPAGAAGGGRFYGWRVLAAASALGFVAFGVVIPGFLAFSVPIREQLGLSSAQAGFVVGAAWGVGDITSLAAGWLADRYGARRFILAGGILCGAGFAALGLAQSFWAVVAAYSVVASVGRGLGIFPTLMTVVNQWFEHRKALAIAVISTAVTAGAAALLPALNYAETIVGWRAAAFAAGGLVCLLTLPAAAIIRSRPEDLGLQPYGVGATAAGTNSAGADPGGTARRRRQRAGAGTARTRDYGVGEALRTLTFGALAAGAILRTVTSDVLVINQIPLLIWKGVAEERTAFYLSLTYFAIIPARFGMGLAANWLSPRRLLGASMLLVALCTAGALAWRGDPVAWFLIAASAAGQGVSALAWIAVGAYFGRRSFGTLVGLMTVCYGVSGLIFPAAAGAAFDRTGTFTPALMLVLALQVVSALAFFLVRPPASGDDRGAA